MTEIYLSKLVLNPNSRRVWNDLGNPQNLHRTISSAFEKIENPPHLKPHERKTPRGEFNLLHRLDFDRRTGRAVLLVQSCARPNWSFLHADYAKEVECKTVHDSYSQIENGMRLRFRLRANPTKRVHRSDAKAHSRFKESQPHTQYMQLHNKHETRRRVELIADEKMTREEKLIEWLRNQGAVRVKIEKGEPVEYSCGFRLMSVAVRENVENVSANPNGKQSFTKPNADKSKSPHRVTLDGVTFEGVLEVTDAEKFREALAKGVGSGKAYGFGLLSVAKAR